MKIMDNQKSLENALDESEKKFHSLFNNMIDGYAYHQMIFDSSGEPIDYVFLEVNDAWENLTGLKRTDVIGKKVTQVVPNIKDDPVKWIEKFGNVAKNGQPLLLENYSMSLKKWFRVLVFSPKKGYFSLNFEDITDQKNLEDEIKTTLKASQKRQSEVAALLRASKAVLRFKEFKKAAKAIFNSGKELIGARAGYIALLNEELNQNDVLFLDSGGLPCTVDPSLIMPIRGLRAESYQQNKTVYDNNFSESRWKKFMPKGHMSLKNVLFAPLIIENRTVGLIGLANKPNGFSNEDAYMAKAFAEIASIALMNSQMLDSLEEKELKLQLHNEHLEEIVEEKTRQLKLKERMAAIGETAGMIGHDIRNPLQSMEGAIYLAKQSIESLQEDNEEKKTLQEVLELLRKQVTYIDHMVADLQEFAKSSKPEFAETDISETIKKSLSKLEIPENIKISISLPEKPLKLFIDPIHCDRIFINLFRNAIQAMPKGGNLIINAYRRDNFVLIEIEDTGIGIPERAKNHIFTPLYTTKSKGQGFGLAVCKKLVEVQDGEISFRSEERKGSIFTIKFPDKLQNMAM